MPYRCTTLAAAGLLCAALLCAASPGVRAEVLTLDCKNARSAYKVVYDTESRAFSRQEGATTQAYRVMRIQFEKGDGLVWGATRERGGDMLAFFGSKTMVKYFYGNGSETTDACVQK